MDYHDRPEVSASMLKSMATGWRTFEAEYITKTAPRKETAAMMLGTAIHCALLEPERYEHEYVICPAECSDRRTKAYKEWAADADNACRIPLSSSDGEIIQRVLDNCQANQAVRAVLELPGKVEHEVYWTDQETDVSCRAKVDKLCDQIIIDIKTTDDARKNPFAKTIASWRYDIQASHYLDGTGLTAFIFLAVEKTSPFRCRLYEISSHDSANAQEARLTLLQQYRDRKVTNDWSEDEEFQVTPLFLPSFLLSF